MYCFCCHQSHAASAFPVVLVRRVPPYFIALRSGQLCPPPPPLCAPPSSLLLACCCQLRRFSSSSRRGGGGGKTVKCKQTRSTHEILVSAALVCVCACAFSAELCPRLVKDANSFIQASSVPTATEAAAAAKKAHNFNIAPFLMHTLFNYWRSFAQEGAVMYTHTPRESECTCVCKKSGGGGKKKKRGGGGGKSLAEYFDKTPPGRKRGERGRERNAEDKLCSIRTGWVRERKRKTKIMNMKILISANCVGHLTLKSPHSVDRAGVINNSNLRIPGLAPAYFCEGREKRTAFIDSRFAH